MKDVFGCITMLTLGLICTVSCSNQQEDESSRTGDIVNYLGEDSRESDSRTTEPKTIAESSTQESEVSESGSKPAFSPSKKNESKSQGGGWTLGRIARLVGKRSSMKKPSDSKSDNNNNDGVKTESLPQVTEESDSRPDIGTPSQPVATTSPLGDLGEETLETPEANAPVESPKMETLGDLEVTVQEEKVNETNLSRATSTSSPALNSLVERTDDDSETTESPGNFNRDTSKSMVDLSKSGKESKEERKRREQEEKNRLKKQGRRGNKRQRVK